MKLKISHLAAAAAITGFLGFGGISLANAQETPTTPPTTADGSTAPPPHDSERCPNMGGSSGSSSGSGSSSSSTSPDTSGT
jgi:hypothetical protein